MEGGLGKIRRQYLIRVETFPVRAHVRLCIRIGELFSMFQGIISHACLVERSSLSECRPHNYSIVPCVPFACGLHVCVHGSAPVRVQPVSSGPFGWLG